MHGKGGDLDACVMDAKDFGDNETGGALTHDTLVGETSAAVFLLMGAVIGVKAEAVEASALSASGIIDLCIPVGMPEPFIALKYCHVDTWGGYGTQAKTLT